MRLKESKTAQNRNNDDFDKVSRISAADRTLNFFQKRQQNRSLNKAFEEADYLNRKIVSRSMLKDETGSDKLEHLSSFLHGKIHKDEARVLRSQQRTHDN